ncbi:glycine/betaine ABC transporter substrate-binding protein [Rhizobium laguerreae]|uniref:glycine betaine ABC transporter substrate-binding protein n=1 Tax=Rhizobium laguerreae TaxID=1076926 RepID=UPI001C90AC27|nr:glycine betaine ABC transporter substrate-binding protein [Rhizobium laguerreae]MBY3165696.1 glycine/betaine ABC transporter substrate-binding protein [Rhizobium laguerreae]
MSRAIRVGHIGLSFHDASATVVEGVLQRHGLQVERSAAPHEEMFKRLGRGEVDILVSAWLPSSHQIYLDPIADGVRKLTVLYSPYCIWGVPDFVPVEAVASVSDLLEEPALTRMERKIQGINPGAGISRFSQEMISRYGLGRAGYHFETGTEADCFDTFETAYKEKRWVVIPLWHPQYLHNRYKIRALDEPLGLLGSRDEATLLVRKDAELIVGPEALAELSDLHIGNDKVSALDDELRAASVLTS